jgi:peptide/nickel transport system substrate-binding protein
LGVLALALMLLLRGAVEEVGAVRGQDAPPRLVIGTIERLATLDPADADHFFAWEALSHLFTGLTRQVPGTLGYELALASDHRVSADGLLHTFTIRPGAAFNDGTPITAQTFADSITRLLSLNGRGGKIAKRYVTSASADAAANTLTLGVAKPIPFMKELLALPLFAPLHPEVYPRTAFAAAPGAFIGNGPYRVESFEPSRALVLSADPGWRGGRPANATVTVQRFAFPADLREALIAGEVDLAWRGLSFDDVDIALRSPQVRAQRSPGLQTFYLLIDVVEEPLNDVIARQGISLMMDRERAAAEGWLNTVTALYTLLPTELSTPDAPTYPVYDYDEAERVLRTGNYTRYRRVESTMQSARTLYGELYAAGVSTINTNIQRQLTFGFGFFDTEPETFLEQIERGQFNMLYVGWTPIVPHPHAYLEPLLASDGFLAAGAHYKNAEIDALLNRAALPPALSADHAALYRQAQAIALADRFVVPLWQTQQVVVMRAGVEGVQIAPNFRLWYENLMKK